MVDSLAVVVVAAVQSVADVPSVQEVELFGTVVLSKPVGSVVGGAAAVVVVDETWATVAVSDAFVLLDSVDVEGDSATGLESATGDCATSASSVAVERSALAAASTVETAPFDVVLFVVLSVVVSVVEACVAVASSAVVRSVWSAIVPFAAVSSVPIAVVSFAPFVGRSVGPSTVAGPSPRSTRICSGGSVATAGPG